MRTRHAFSAITLAATVASTACNRSNSPSSIVGPTPVQSGRPVATYSVSGTVSESGGGRPIESATVSVPSSAAPYTPTTTMTDGNGFYRLTDLIAWQLSSINFSKAGFEGGYRSYNTAGTTDIRLQRSLLISAGDTLSATLYPDDPFFSDFTGDNTCEPCKLIRVNMARGGTLDIQLTVPAQSAGAGLMVETNNFSSGVSCCKSEITRSYAVEPSEVKLRVYTQPGSPAEPLPFELTTALR